MKDQRWGAAAIMLSTLGAMTVQVGAAETTAPQADPPAAKTVRLLAIGNSFSQNAAEYLPQIAASQGNRLVVQQASIGGCPLEKHWKLAQAYEANPESPEGRPYDLSLGNGRSQKVSLQEMLRTQAWDVVTIQQQSWDSRDLGTYRPYAAQVAAYVRQHAPQAKLWVHETWAYRPDHPFLKKDGMTQAQMYQGLHAAYATIAAEVRAEGIVPTGTAFQNAQQDPRWRWEMQAGFDPKALKFPDDPPEVHALCVGWNWKKGAQPPVLQYDGKHCTSAGKYLAAMVWYEVFLGEVHGTVFAPKSLSPDDAAFLREIAHRTVREGLQPQVAATAVQLPTPR